jgi:phage terminase large subunit-like protein
MTPRLLKQFEADPLAFIENLRIPSAHGPQTFGVCMAPFQRERFNSIAPALLAVARGEKPAIGRHWLEATKGSSKSSDLACCLLWLLAFAIRPLTCQVGAADADQAAELRKAAQDILRLNPWLADRVEVQNWKLICKDVKDGKRLVQKSNGATCDIVSADVTGSHGARPDVVFLSEAVHITKQEFAENLLDNASKVPNGLVAIETNAGHVGTWQWKWRELARLSDRWIFHQFAEPAPWLDPSEIAEAEKRNSRSRFLRLWWGVWASGVGDALDPADIEAMILTADAHRPEPGQLTGPERYCGYAAGLDLGIKHDHSALVILGRNGLTQRIRLAQCQSWAPGVDGKVDLMAVEEAVYEAWRTFRFGVCGYDPFQCGLLSQRLERRGVPMREVPFAGKNLDRMASTLLEASRSRRIDLYRDELLLRDLRRLSIVEKSFGHKLEAVSDADGHADRAIAFAIALPLAIEVSPMAGQPWGGVINAHDISADRLAGSREVPLAKPAPKYGGHMGNEFCHLN